jgi:hypothetical protein
VTSAFAPELLAALAVLQDVRDLGAELGELNATIRYPRAGPG